MLKKHYEVSGNPEEPGKWRVNAEALIWLCVQGLQDLPSKSNTQSTFVRILQRKYWQDDIVEGTHG